MKEIVDLAFRVVAMKYLHLDHYPLILDEWGASFDPQHRNNAIAAIKSLLDTRPFTQLWCVSHYAASYGAFTNAQICVPDERNIEVPKVYNTHVKIN